MLRRIVPGSMLCLLLLAAPLPVTAALNEFGEQEELKFLEWDGYFRMRGDLFHNLDMGVLDNLRPLDDTSDTAESSSMQDKSPGRSDSLLTSGNLRVKLLPTFNVSEDVKLKLDINILDNVVLGSTPDTLNYTTDQLTSAGINGFSSTQMPPRAGINSWQNSIEVLRAWAEVMTPFGLIRAGRQASSWGLGMFVNDGLCPDCDYGDTVDRVMFATKLFGHFIVAGMDFPFSGPTDYNTRFFPGQVKDATNKDDVMQWLLAVAKRDKPTEIEEKLDNNELVVNYGIYNVIRLQNYTIENTEKVGLGQAGDYAGKLGISNDHFLERNLRMYIGDVWFKLLTPNLHLELEFAYLDGSIGSRAPTAGLTGVKGAGIRQWGGVVQADWTTDDKTMWFGGEVGAASGDRAPGWGTDPMGPSGAQYVDDDDINNFRFDPDYHVDLILWREIIGMVTDAVYFKGFFQYNVTPLIGTRLDVIYSMAMFPESTPSGAKPDLGLGASSRSLGVELDLDLFYGSADGFKAGLAYGVFFPLGAFGYVSAKDAKWHAAQIAQTFQGRFLVEF